MNILNRDFSYQTLSLKLSALTFLLSAFCFLLSACSGKSEGQQSMKYQQYYNQGEQLYVKHCSNCHQKDGKGLGRLYPPLNTSDYMNNNLDSVLCLIRNGKSGELIVNGVSFNKTMPSIPTLSDLEIAEISTYIYNTWNHKRGIIDVTEVTTTLSNCK